MWDANHPYRLRTWIRSNLPWFLINLGLAGKAQDCESIGGTHAWYKKDASHSACYHCKIVLEGQFWKE
jgi:hypothetical protein